MTPQQEAWLFLAFAIASYLAIYQFIHDLTTPPACNHCQHCRALADKRKQDEAKRKNPPPTDRYEKYRKK